MRYNLSFMLEKSVYESLTYEANAPAQDKEPVEAARIHELVCLVLGEAARVAEEIDEGDGDAAVHVQYQVWLLRGRDLLDVERVVKERRGGEVGLDKVLDKRHPHVGVVDRLDPVPDAHDQLSLLPHGVHELHRDLPRVVRPGELLGRAV